ncbi:Ribosomal protein L18 [Mycoplasma suis KI3806]|uniref:Ribosomal protein L18 n=1 Tax=Mycoplasma suis (strain KI_3806) TaxID=708248 RepID=F0V3P6_MYCS3|nr:50S ribosomal protein L18 [Mycoplasma suis]CBZ40468.1 Ribosomal protein L18 [Mycoplasma suis KI3806]
MSKDSLVEIKKRQLRRAKRVSVKSKEGKRYILRVKKTNLHLYLLVRSHITGKMLFSCSTLQLRIKKGSEEYIEKLTASLIEKLKERNIDKLSLDRGYHSYSGTLQKVREILLANEIKI